MGVDRLRVMGSGWGEGWDVGIWMMDLWGNRGECLRVILYV